MRIFFALLFLFCAGVAHAEEKLSDPAFEMRAQTVMKELRCLVCQGESVAESGADFAKDIRTLVREQVKAGKNEGEVLQFMQARYGDYILMTPPLASRTLLLWLMPVLTLIFGAVFAARYWRSRGT